MTDTLDKPQDKPQVNGKTVQEYIDELPTWPDGTMLPTTPMTAMQFRIWALACAGKFFEGMVVFMTGVALPLIAIQFHLNAADKGFVTAASLAGILIGATALGGLADSVRAQADVHRRDDHLRGVPGALTFAPTSSRWSSACSGPESRWAVTTRPRTW